MRFRCIRLFALCTVSATMSFTIAAAQDAAPQMPSPEEMAKMREAIKKYTTPGEHHKLLNRNLGKWKTETRFFMGGQPSPPSKGEAEVSWLIDGRWLISKHKGELMGHPHESVSILGYDNFKQSYVFTVVGNIDTAMLSAEGDMTPDGKALIMYGTLDEYTTGEHDKMVKYVYRFLSHDRIVMEVHDLPIGETNTKVVEMTFTRAE